MRIDKTSVPDITAGKDSKGVQAQKTSSVVQPPSIQIAKSSMTANRSVLSMINSASLPADKLSASIITLARFFSLPLKPELMADIRRQVFVSNETPHNETLKQTAVEKKTDFLQTAKYRDALSMAAAAAESKGVELKQLALYSYAGTVDPDLRDRKEGSQNREKKNKNEQKNEKAELKQTDINPSSLEKTAMEYLEKDQLLNLLNKIPGKNKQHWIVIPLDFFRDGKEYRASLKLLLDLKIETNRSVLMNLDILESGNSESRLSFILESVNDKVVKLSVYSQSVLTVKENKNFKSELSKLFGLPKNHIFIQTCGDSIICAGYDKDLLLSIDEEV